MKVLKEKSRIINVCPGIDPDAGLEEAKDVLLSGGVVAFPTESFYGLAVNAMDEKAIDRLFSIKNREPDLPVLILIPSLDTLNIYVEEIPEIARILIKQFWPGGLTMLFKAMPCISQRLTAGTGKIGVRLSSHPIATALAQTIKAPITGTSANISGRPACMRAMEVYNDFKKGVLILDGGETGGGKGSTILDVTVKPPKIMREGMIGSDRLGL